MDTNYQPSAEEWNEKKMMRNNEKRIANYMKQRKSTSMDCLTFRQKRRIRKHEKKQLA
jgi:hypothetical protein